MKELGVDMAGISPFISHPDTPWVGEAGGFRDDFKALSVDRIILKNVHLLPTTAMGSIHLRGREAGLEVGVNEIKPNTTLTKYRQLYQGYLGKVCIDGNTGNCLRYLAKRVNSVKRKIARDKGHSLRYASLCSGH